LVNGRLVERDIPERCSHRAQDPQRTDGKTGLPGEALLYQCLEKHPKIFQLSLNEPQFLSPAPKKEKKKKKGTPNIYILL
jgi:hypothetical protein